MSKNYVAKYQYVDSASVSCIVRAVIMESVHNWIMDENIETLIEEVEKRPAIYNKTNTPSSQSLSDLFTLC